MSGPGRPVFHPSPAVATAFAQGTWARPPRTDFATYEDVLRGDPNAARGTDAERTAYLQAAYGLPAIYAVRQGQIVDARNPVLRNLWWEGPLAIGGAGAIQALAGAGGGAGLLPSSQPVSAGVGMHAVPPAVASQAASGAAGTLAASSPFTAAGMTAVPPAVRNQHVSTPVPIGEVRPPGGPDAPDRPASPEDWMKKGFQALPLILAALATRSGGGVPGGDPTDPNSFLGRAYGDAQRLNALKETRFRRVDPLHEAVTQLAFNRLPDTARAGITLPRLPLPEGSR